MVDIEHEGVGMSETATGELVELPSTAVVKCAPIQRAPGSERSTRELRLCRQDGGEESEILRYESE